MKKLLFVLFMFVCFISFGQRSNGFEAFVADTTTNAETEYLVIDSPSEIGRSYAISITIVPENESGTATVTSMPQGYDGETWFDLQAAVDTINTAGTVANKIYVYPEAYFLQYRVKLVSTGTGVTSFAGKLGLSKK